MDDRYDATEDLVLNTQSGPIISVDFDTNSGGVVPVFDGDWDYLDALENQIGANDSYPVDDAGRSWNSVDFEVGSSSIGPWLSGALPLQGGIVQAFPAITPNLLRGIGDGPNGQNTVTTYLFRNTFVLTPEDAARENWIANLAVDDGCVIYINGVEAGSIFMPGTAIDSNTFARNGNESTYNDVELDVAGVLVAGTNTIAVEVHQGSLGSSDAGLDISLQGGGGLAGGFVFLDDAFGTDQPEYAAGILDPSGGFSGAGLQVTIGGLDNRTVAGPYATSGAFTQSFTLAAAATLEVSLRYRLINTEPLEASEFGEAILEIDGVRYGDDTNNSLVHINNGGDSDWQSASFSVSLQAGNHTFSLGAYSDGTSRPNEEIRAYFDEVFVTQGADSSGGVMENDTVGENASAGVVRPPVHGVVNMAPDGVFLYTPAVNFFGTDSFTYAVTDEDGTSEPATVIIEVQPVNDPPIAVPETYSVAEDGSLNVSIPGEGVLDNDSDLESEDLSAIREEDVEHGSLTLSSNGTFTYTPDEDYFGTDSFSYRASDGSLQSGVTVVTLTVEPRPDAPVTQDDSYVALENEVLEVIVTGGAVGGAETVVPYGANWRFNDTGTDLGDAWRDPGYNDSQWESGPAELGYGDGDEDTEVGFGGNRNDKHPTTYFRRTFTVEDADAIVSATCRVFRDDGIVVFLNGTQIGIDNIDADPSYDDFAQQSVVDDGNLEIVLPPVSPALFVGGDNTLAVEIHQADRGSSDLSFNLELEIVRDAKNGLLDNDADLDGVGLTATVESGPTHGSIVLNANGTFFYTPELNFEGEDSFVYRASNGAASSLGVVTINVLPGLNDIPETQPDTYSPGEDSEYVRNASQGVLMNDVDPDEDELTATLVSSTLHGVLHFNGDGSFSYLPTRNYFGPDSFTYTASDGKSVSPVETVTLNVINVEDVPETISDTYAIDPGGWITVDEQDGVLANDFDPDGTPLVAELVDPVTSGDLILSPVGAFFYRAADGSPGSVSFTYRATDGVLASPETTVTIYLDRAPNGVTDSYSIQEDTPRTVLAGDGVLSNDSDAEDDPLTAVLLSPPAHGLLVLNQDGSFSYTPEEDFEGADGFTYSAMDGVRASGPVAVSLTVLGINDPPVTVDDSYLAILNQELAIGAAAGVLANDFDVDSATLMVSLVNPPVEGDVTLNEDGSFIYTHPPEFAGTDSFTYRVSDGSLGSGPGKVTIQIGGASDAIVINEIMYHPESENVTHEFIELANIGDGPVRIKDWSFTSGIGFTFPDLTIPAGGFLVVAADQDEFTSIYGVVDQLTGGWTGSLSNRGENIRLVDEMGEQVDEVGYHDQGEWATRTRVTDTGEPGWTWEAAHDGTGESLELIQAALTNKSGQNWQASDGGPTPGAVNSAALDESAVAPLIQDVAHSPLVPRSTDTVTIRARLRDTSMRNLSATLFYRVSALEAPEFSTIAMVDDGLHDDGDADDGVFGASLPAMEEETIVEFYLSASDGNNVRTWPAPTDIGQVANLHYQVDDEPNPEGEGIYRIIMTRAESQAFSGVDRDSNAQHHCTLVADDCSGPVVRYQCGVRVRGASSRQDNPPPMRINIPRDRPWNGSSQMNVNTQFTWLQFIGMKLFQASDLPAPDSKRIAFRRNGSDPARERQEDYGSFVHLQPLNFEFVDKKMSKDSQGNLYKKVRPDVNWAYRGGDLDRYARDGWGKQTNGSENDWTDLDEFLRVMNRADNDPDYINQVEAVANLDQWMRWFAVETLIANGETNASNGTDDDYSMYRGVLDPRFLFIPHDLDTILGRGDGSRIADPQHTIFDMVRSGQVLGPLVPLFEEPTIRVRYFQALRNLMQTSFSKTRFDALLTNHLSGWVPENVIDDLIDFMDARRNHVEGIVDGELGPAPPLLAPATLDSENSPHGAIYLSEVFAVNKSAHEVDGKFPDYIELGNTGVTRSLSGYSITDDPSEPRKFVFPPGITIASDQRLMLYADSGRGQGIHLGFSLNGAGENVLLFNPDGALVDSVVFGPQVENLSIGRTGPGETTWRLTLPTPGESNQAHSLGNPAGLLLNEWLSKPEVIYTQDFLELYNPELLPISIGGLLITDDPLNFTRSATLPALSFVGGGGFAVLEAVGAGANSPSELPFKLGASYGWVAIYGSNQVEIDRVHTVCAPPDQSQGRATDGAALYAQFPVPTPGFSNATDLSAESLVLQSLRITEIMYHPAGFADSEFIEVRNTGDLPISLDGVEFTKGIEFEFPDMTLAPGEYAVVVSDTDVFQAVYGFGVNIAGEWSGRLDNDQDRLRLEIVALNAVVHDFTYRDSWYPSTDGGGYSLVIVDESANAGWWGERESWTAGAVGVGSPGVGSGFFVFGGRDQEIVLPAGSTLNATVHYGPLDPATVTLDWILENGPGVATFGNGNNEDTTVTVPVAGRYTFALIATPEDGPIQTGEVTVIFRDSYEAWALRQFGDPDVAAAQRLADEDGDDLPNLVEFALGLDPYLADAEALITPFRSSRGELSQVYFRPYLSEDYRVIPEVSSDLVSWQSGSAFVSEAVLTATDQGEWIQADDRFIYDGVTPRFIRLRVDSPDLRGD
ncbi:MAG: Ig-like domain-containing protein [Roseibacillus sp.]|nr:Ig-like domain-containing protein [Roseibacillus sp.]